MSLQSQDFRAAYEKIEHQSSRDENGHTRANGSPLHSHVQHVYEQIVEGDIHDTHGDIERTGDFHVSRALEHRTSQSLHLEKNAAAADDKEID